ncbi:MAG TPA: hypothetical protein VGN14_10235 [Candidatus Elarobacter sp.]|jgi:hypothetical protein
MRRAVASTAALLAFCATLVVTALPAAADRDDGHHGHGYGRCGRNKVWVPPHYGRNGHWIRGHCRHR